jgi:hypothetical protein
MITNLLIVISLINTLLGIANRIANYQNGKKLNKILEGKK